MRYHHGTPSFFEHTGLWKRTPDEPDVTPEEHDRVYTAFHKWLKKRVKDWDPLAKDVPCYFIGDFTYDRTQALEFNDYAFLTPELVNSLQALLRCVEYSNWRISLGTGHPEDIMMIYPDVVCGVRQLLPNEVDAVVRETSRRIVERDALREQERQARLERIRPLCAKGYDQTRMSGHPTLVATEANADGRPGIVRMWVLHPFGEDLLQLYEYSNSPEALLYEKRYVLPGGVLTETSRDRPPNGLFLAGWEFEEGPGRTFTMERAGRVTRLEY